MKLRVLGSGSSGNCYVLENETEALIIEAGVPFMEVKKILNFNVRKIAGVAVSHSHGDHAKYISEYEKAGIPVFKPYEKAEPMVFPNCQFFIQVFDLVHDVPCYGFFIKHPEMGNLVYASDTEYIKWRFQNVNHILVEANYSNDYMGQIEPSYDHVLRGHMSIETVGDFLQVNNSPALKNVVLCHLSVRNADVGDFVRRVEEIVDCSVYAAEKGLEVDLK